VLEELVSKWDVLTQFTWVSYNDETLVNDGIEGKLMVFPLIVKLMLLLKPTTVSCKIFSPHVLHAT
jgi:hypothetical protein